MSPMMDEINRRYTVVANNMNDINTGTFGYLCDIYFPKHHYSSPNKQGTMQGTNIYEPGALQKYSDVPDVPKVQYIIVGLYKDENVNSPENVFDSFYSEEDDDRPFIETTTAKELPDNSKVVVYLSNSKMYFFVDRKTVTNGADGHKVLRMYLDPLSER